jgi:hypothetical protein
MADKEKILAALAQLDPLDDDQWTADGAPKVDTVAELVGAAVTRKDIVESAPDFNREKAGEGDANEDDNESDDTGDGEGSNEQEQTQEHGGNGDQETSSEGGTDTEASNEEQPDAEMTEAEFMAYLNTVPKEDLEDLAGSLRDQKIMVDKEIEEKKALGLRIKKAINIVNLRVKQLHPNTSATAATRRFIESQNAARMDRVARRSVVLKHLSAKDIEPRAPIDAAMARKNKRGSGRPTRPLMK